MITKRIWKSGPRRIKRVKWGFTAQRNGKQVRRVREEWTKEDAERAFSEWTIEGVTSATDTVAAPAGMTFGAMVEKFLAKKKSEGKRSIQDDEERSVPLLAFFGKATPLAAIRTHRVAEYRMARRATTSRLGRPLAPATVNREVALLRSILRMALAWDELERVPVFEMTKEQGKQRYLALDEITRLLAACAESRSRLLLAIVTAAPHTGLRKGELLRLIWERVDFARSVIALGRQTKSGKGRDVPINQAVYGALAPLRAAAGGQDASGRVWGALRDIDTPYRTALTRAKILDPDVTFHTRRHSFASHDVMRGGRLEKLQEILGHSSIKTTEIYKHLAADYLTGATALLEGLGAEINAQSTHGAETAAEQQAGVS